MFPWTKLFIEKNQHIQPKTILYGSKGANIVETSDEIVKNLISNIDNKNYQNIALDQIASPNFYILHANEGKAFISIDQIRAPKNFLTLNSGKNRVLYIQNAENIRINGFNALLKVSEEAGDNVFIVISTSDINAIPSTILSRFQQVKITKPQPKEVISFVKERKVSINENLLEFIGLNPWLLEDKNEKFLDVLQGFDEKIEFKEVQTKEKAELCVLIDYLIFLKKNDLKSPRQKDSLKAILELTDIKKSLNLPNNLSVEIAQLRINSCL